MRVLFLTHYFPPEGNAPATRTHAMCKRWARDGHDVTVITSTPNVPDGIPYEGYKNKLIQREEIDGIETIRVWTYLAANKGAVRRIINYVSYMLAATFAGLFVRKPDVVIATSPQFFCGWAGVIVSKLRRLPFILEVRDIWPESVIAVGAMSGSLLIAVLEKLERWMYAAAAHIVTVGDGYKSKLVEKGVAAAGITVITNGVDLDVFYPRPADRELCDRYQLDGHFVCAYVGTIGMASGLDVVLRAARILEEQRDDVRFLIVGDGAVREALEEEARAAQLDNVIFTGRQGKELIPGFLSVADACLVHLKKKDLFKTVLPSKIFEAAAMARPIILGVEGHAADVVWQAGAGICIEPENADELVAAVNELADDRKRREELGRAGRQCVERHYESDRLAGRYLELIQQIPSAHSVAASTKTS